MVQNIFLKLNTPPSLKVTLSCSQLNFVSGTVVNILERRARRWFCGRRGQGSRDRIPLLTPPSQNFSLAVNIFFHYNLGKCFLR